jgi:hypothetical protein
MGSDGHQFGMGMGQQSDSDPVGNTKRDEPELFPPLYTQTLALGPCDNLKRVASAQYR